MSLISKFIKNSENTKDPNVRAAYGKFSGVVGIVANIFLFIIKLIAGTIGGGISVAIVADAANNLSDASSSFISLLGFKLAEKPADKEHPYGHGRYEYLSGLIISALILVIGVELMKQGVGKIFDPEPFNLTLISSVILIVSIFIKLFLMIMNKSLGDKISSDTLIATSKDSRNDVISTSAVLLSAVVSKYTSLELDGYTAVIVAVFILISGCGLIKETIAPLLGKAPDKEFVDEVEEKILSFPNVLGVHDLMIHDYGPGRMYGSVHVEMSSKLDVLEGHEIIDDIEKFFYSQYKLIISIHYDPVVTDDPMIPEIKAFINNIVKSKSEDISIHDLRMVPGVGHTNIIFDCVIPHKSKLSNNELKLEIENRVSEKYPNYMCVINFEHSYSGK